MAYQFQTGFEKGPKVNFYKHWPLWRTLLGMSPDPKIIASREADELAIDVLQRELVLIDDQFRIKARKAKIEFIHKWLSER